MVDHADQLHHQSDTDNPARRPALYQQRPYKLPWYQDTFWATLINRASNGRIFPYPEQHDDFVAPEEYLPGYKSKHGHKRAKQSRTNSGESEAVNQSPPSLGASDATHVNHQHQKQQQQGGGGVEGQTTMVATSPKDAEGEEEKAGRGNYNESPPDDLNDETDPYLVDWNGPNDPDNPLNWPFRKRVFVTGLICLLTFSVYLGSAIYSPGIELVAAYFHVGTVVATLGLTLFVFGYGIGPMIGLSAASEIPAIGRSLPYLLTLFLFVILQIPTALVNNIAGFMILRFLAGLFGSPPLATGGASIVDMYGPRNRPLAIAVWGLSAVCGPVLGPLIGGFASQSFGIQGWRWTIWPLLMLSGFTLVVLILTLPETSSSNILYRRAQRLRKVTGNPNLRTKGEIFSSHLNGKEIALMTIVRPFELSFTQPIVLGINLHIGLVSSNPSRHLSGNSAPWNANHADLMNCHTFSPSHHVLTHAILTFVFVSPPQVYGILYLWFEAFPIVFNQTYGFNAGQSGLAFMGIFVGAILVYIPFFLWHRYSYAPLYDKQNGKVPPEKWLEPAILGAWAIPICMFGFGWTANRAIPWIVPIIMSSFFSIGTFLLFQSGLAYLGDCYPEYIASVYGGNDFFRSSIGAALPLVSLSNTAVTPRTILWRNLVYSPITTLLLAHSSSTTAGRSCHVQQPRKKRSTRIPSRLGLRPYRLYLDPNGPYPAPSLQVWAQTQIHVQVRRRP